MDGEIALKEHCGRNGGEKRGTDGMFPYRWREMGNVPSVPRSTSPSAATKIFSQNFTSFGGMCGDASLAATDAILLPKPKPRAVGEHLVVPSIRSRDVARGQRPRVRYGE